MALHVFAATSGNFWEAPRAAIAVKKTFHWSEWSCRNSLSIWLCCTHTYWSARDARSDFSVCRLTKWGHKYMNNIPRVTSWAFDGFIWVKRSSYHIYIGYRNLKGPHGNLSKYKFGLAEYITVYVIQLQQLLQLLLRIITQYAKYVYFKFYKMFTECFWVISVLMSLLIF